MIAPSYSGGSFYIEGGGGEVEFNSDYPTDTMSFKFNRGAWSNAYNSSGIATSLLPYNGGAVTIGSASGDFGALTASTTDTVTDEEPSILTWTASLPSGEAFSELKTYTLNASLQTSATSTGAVYDAQGGIGRAHV